MVAKAIERNADAIVFDLEDSVPVSEKPAARSVVSDVLSRWPTTSHSRPFVRINPPRMNMLDDDAGVLARHGQVGIVVPKVDRPIELDAVFAIVGRTSRDMIVNIETPRSILRLEEFADTHGVTGLFLGGEDLTEALGMRRTDESQELTIPRFMLLAACRAAGIAAFDTICPEFRNFEIVERDARKASAMGYDGKFAIHPAQIDAIHRAFTPSDEELAEAKRIVKVYDEAVAEGRGAVQVDGKMIDPPVAERARALVARAAAHCS